MRRVWQSTVIFPDYMYRGQIEEMSYLKIFWGNDLLDTTQGLDILGIRGFDQSIEIGMVNGITTISQRVRYLSILTWALGEVLIQKSTTGAKWEEVEKFLRRVEFLVLAATRLDKEINGADAVGTLGTNLLQEDINALLNGADVSIPDDKGGAILGTYLGPCRATGLLVDGEAPVFYRLTPRGKEIWEARNRQIATSPLVMLLHEGGSLTRGVAETAIPDFSLAALSQRTEEATLLWAALTTPWSPVDEASQTRVDAAYNGLIGTIDWASALLEEQPDTATGVITRNYEKCCNSLEQDRVSATWAEYEYRRRCHLSLELLLSALTRGLANHEEATIFQIVMDWSREPDVSNFLTAMWPDATGVWGMPAGEAIGSVPKGLFLGAPMPTGDLRHLPPLDQVLAAVGILSATAKQTAAMRSARRIDMRSAMPGDQAVGVVEKATDEPVTALIEELLHIAAIAHLQTTLRKMGGEQKCSLRFFPEGPVLRPTGLGMTPGHSGDRLTNVLKFLTDLGILDATENGLAPADGAF